MYVLWSGGCKTKRQTKENPKRVDWQTLQLNKEDAMHCSKWRKFKTLDNNHKDMEWAGDCFSLVSAYLVCRGYVC